MYVDVVELHSTEDPIRWARACGLSGQPVHPFLTYPFLESVAPLAFSVFRPLIVRYQGYDVGVLPWLERRKGPLAVVNQVPFPYVGPLVPLGLLRATLVAARRHARLTGAIKQSYQFGPGVYVDQAIGGLGFRATTDSTYVVDVTDSDAMWARLHASTRKRINAAKRKGVVFSDVPAPATLDDVMSTVFAAKGLASGYRTVAPPDLARNGLQVNWGVPMLNGQPVGAQLTVLYEGAAAAWQGGVLPQYRDTSAGVAIYWDAMCWAHQAGAKTLDMVGNPDAGIATFKSQFGGDLCEYPTLDRVVRSIEAARSLSARARSFTRGRSRPQDSVGKTMPTSST